MRPAWAGLAILATLIVACGEHHDTEIETRKIEDIPEEIRIPTKLWDEIQTAPEGEVGETDGVLFMHVDVILEEKNRGVLTRSPVKIRLPRGGGVIDLSEHVTDKPGSFFVRFEWPDVEDPATLRSWFVSKAKRRKLGGDIWGAGCNKYFRITEGLNKVARTGGLKVNTTRDRHVTTLGGHFIFAARNKAKQTLAAQVTFKDPNRPDFYCEEL